MILHQERGYKAFNKQFLCSTHMFREYPRTLIGLFYQKFKSKTYLNMKNTDTTKIHCKCYVYFLICDFFEFYHTINHYFL